MSFPQTQYQLQGLHDCISRFIAVSWQTLLCPKSLLGEVDGFLKTQCATSRFRSPRVLDLETFKTWRSSFWKKLKGKGKPELHKSHWFALQAIKKSEKKVWKWPDPPINTDHLRETTLSLELTLVTTSTITHVTGYCRFVAALLPNQIQASPNLLLPHRRRRPPITTRRTKCLWPLTDLKESSKLSQVRIDSLLVAIKFVNRCLIYQLWWILTIDRILLQCHQG